MFREGGAADVGHTWDVSPALPVPSVLSTFQKSALIMWRDRWGSVQVGWEPYRKRPAHAQRL